VKRQFGDDIYGLQVFARNRNDRFTVDFPGDIARGPTRRVQMLAVVWGWRIRTATDSDPRKSSRFRQ